MNRPLAFQTTPAEERFIATYRAIMHVSQCTAQYSYMLMEAIRTAKEGEGIQSSPSASDRNRISRLTV
jgi:hypothetical protein